MIRSIAMLGAVLLGALVAPAVALAAPATATTTVNVRNAPGNGAVIGVLSAGERVDADRCSGGWCFVSWRGPNGWVSANYLRIGGSGPVRPVPSSPSGPSRPDINLGFSVPGFSFQIGNGGFDGRPGRPGRPGGRDQVCFYEDNNFRGGSFCARPGEDLARLGRWDEEISSIRIQGDARALVCERTNFGGRCIPVSRDVRDLGPANDRIRSIRVR